MGYKKDIKHAAIRSLLLITLPITAVAANAVSVHAAGLIGDWKLDEGTGTTVIDSSGNGNNGTIIQGSGTGSPTWVSPGHDASFPFTLDFDGSGTTATATNSVNLGNASILDQMDNYTVSLWVKFKPGYVGTGGAWANLVGRNASGADWAWMIYVNNLGQIRPHHRNSDGSYAPLTDSSVAMPVGEWVHIEQVADNGKLHLYINGKEDPNFPINYSGTTYSLPSANTYIGMDRREHAPLATISHVKIYNDAMTAPQVATNIATNITRTSATLNGTLSSLGDATTTNVFFRYRVAGSSDPYSQTSPQTLSTTGPFSANISGLSSGVQYEFKAVTQWTGRDGIQEAEGALVDFTTPTGPTAPAPAVDLQAIPNGTDRIDLSWTAPDDGGNAITGYKIERSLDGVTWEVIVANTGNADTIYQDMGRSSNTKYYYRVAAINTLGEATSSNVASATLGANSVDGTNTSSAGLASTGQDSVPIIGFAGLLISIGVLSLLKRVQFSGSSGQ
jgi:hypothetical protein